MTPLSDPATIAPLAHPDGSPGAIEDASHELVRQLHAGSVDGEGFAENVSLALAAMGITMPPTYMTMLRGMIAQGFAA